MQRGHNCCFADPLFLSCQKKWAKRGAGCGSDCTAVPQNEPMEEHCGQHTINSLQIYTTAPPAWRQRSHREQLPHKEMAKHAAVEITSHLRMRRWCEFLMERADDPVRPVRLSYTFVGADGERSRQRRRSATDAAHPLRVHIGPSVGYSGNEQDRN